MLFVSEATIVLRLSRNFSAQLLELQGASRRISRIVQTGSIELTGLRPIRRHDRFRRSSARYKIPRPAFGQSVPALSNGQVDPLGHPRIEATCAGTERCPTMNTITLYRDEHELNGFEVHFSNDAVRWVKLWVSSLENAVLEAARIAGLDADYRDARGQEWDILIPEKTQNLELPDLDVHDRWFKLLSLEIERWESAADGPRAFPTKAA